MKGDKLLKIDDVVNILSELKKKHGNLPFYLFFDDFIYVPVNRIEIAKEAKERHVHNPEMLPRRVVCMGGVDSQAYEAD